jgi:hypothetical protein
MAGRRTPPMPTSDRQLEPPDGGVLLLVDECPRAAFSPQHDLPKGRSARSTTRLNPVDKSAGGCFGRDTAPDVGS